MSDKSNYIFMGPLFLEDEEQKFYSLCNGYVPSIASNVFQWSLIHGIENRLGHEIDIIHCLPIGSFPKSSNKIKFNNKEARRGVSKVYEIGCINLPVLKQLTRYYFTKRILRELRDENVEIILYSTYFPFLQALKKSKKNLSITLIVTDLPEFYDVGEVKLFRKILRYIQNIIIYKCLERVDRYVLLTEQMKKRLPIYKKPYIIMEGIFNANNDELEVKSINKDIIFYSGSLRYIYGIKALLLAFNKIEEKNLELWICGSGEAESEIKLLSRKDPRVKFFGFCSQQRVAELRNQASILVNPRKNDSEYTKYSFPSKTIEYMASGKPVIMYHLDGVPQEYDRFLFYVDDMTGGLSEKIVYVLQNIEVANVIAKEAKQFILDNKDSNTQAKRLLDFING